MWGYSPRELEAKVLPVQPLRRRYLAVKVDGDGVFLRGDVETLVRDLASKGQVNITFLRLIEYDPETGLGIVRCSHRSVDEVRLSLSASVEVGKRRATVRIFGVSGTIRALRRKFMRKSFGTSFVS